MRTHLLCSVIVFLAGCGPKTEPAEKGSKVEEKTKVGPAVAPAVAIDAAQFFAEAKKGGDAEKLKGSLVELSGVVSMVDWAENGGRAYISLKGGDGLFDHVTCYTKEARPWNLVSVGQEVRLRGKVPDLSIVPMLVETELVEAGKNGAPTIASTDLAAEFSKNRDATDTKYKEKSLIVTGEIMAKDMRRVQLKGDGNTKIEASFDGFVGALADPLKVGDKITIQVKYDPLLTREGVIGFYIPLLMTK